MYDPVGVPLITALDGEVTLLNPERLNELRAISTLSLPNKTQ